MDLVFVFAGLFLAAVVLGPLISGFKDASRGNGGISGGVVAVIGIILAMILVAWLSSLQA